jgi:hypothetical protein
VDRVLGAGGDHQGVEARDPDQAEAHNQQAGDGAAAEGDLHGGVDAVIGGLGGAYVGANRDGHADVAGQAREQGTDGEAERGGPVEKQADDEEQHDTRHADGRVLAVQVGLGTFLDSAGDLLHARRAGRFGEDPFNGSHAVDQREKAAGQGEYEFNRHRKSPVCEACVRVAWLHRHPEFRAGPEAEQGLQVEFPYQGIDCRLAMVALDLGKDQPRAVAVVAATHVGLHGKQFAGLFQCHGRESFVCECSPQRRVGSM